MKNTFLILLAVGMLAACGTKPEATIDGTVTDIEDGRQIYRLDNNRAKLDSTVVVGGKFRFDIAEAYPDRNYLSFEGRRERFQFIVEPGTIVATVNVDPWSELFTGTPTNDAQKAIYDGATVFTDRMSEIEAKLNALEADGLSSGTPEFDSLLTVYHGITDEYDQYTKNAVMETPNSILAAYFIYSNAYSFIAPAEVDSVLNIIVGAPANAFTDRLRERRDVLAKTAVGSPAPDFTQAQPDGAPLSLSSLRGKLVLIDFWASWCGPCRVENPNVVKVYKKYHDRGFEILGVSLDDNRENWLKAIADDGLIWKHVSDLGGWNNAVAVQYAVRSIPHTVLVGADGVIIAKNLRGAALEAKIAEVLGVTE